ncbi:hypothetical protein [Actinokineospora sp. HUAS TT18]|uniref:hypothetical protein n=1 Tax=Actinokineospora sp. HUAS TT18 TaxID=3447451 RepID=UPI003F51C8A0
MHPTSLTDDLAAPSRRGELVSWLQGQVDVNRALSGTAGWMFSCVEDLVLNCGFWGVPASLPGGHGCGPGGQCYANASRYSEVYGATYVEGYSLTHSGLVYAHAWCVDDQGAVHDPTWSDGAGLAYLGILFSADYARSVEIQPHRTLLHDAHLDWRILRHGFPPAAINPVGEPVTLPR